MLLSLVSLDRAFPEHYPLHYTLSNVHYSWTISIVMLVHCKHVVLQQLGCLSGIVWTQLL